MSDETKKLSFRVAVELADDVDRVAALLYQNRTQVLTAAVSIGLRYLDRVLEPEKYATPQLLASMNEAGLITDDELEQVEGGVK